MWDLLDVKSEAGLLLAIMSFRPQTYATRPQGLVDSSKPLNIWSLPHGIEPHKHLPLSFYDKKLGFITEFGIFKIEISLITLRSCGCGFPTLLPEKAVQFDLSQRPPWGQTKVAVESFSWSLA